MTMQAQKPIRSKSGDLTGLASGNVEDECIGISLSTILKLF
jgi:hypothetical protein